VFYAVMAFRSAISSIRVTPRPIGIGIFLWFARHCGLRTGVRPSASVRRPAERALWRAALIPSNAFDTPDYFDADAHDNELRSFMDAGINWADRWPSSAAAAA